MSLSKVWRQIKMWYYFGGLKYIFSVIKISFVIIKWLGPK
jgi:hypothetical protein